MSANGAIRPLNLQEDIDELIALLEICFAGELANRGGDLGEELRSAQKSLALLSFLGRFSESFQHMLDGFVWVEDGRIAASVNVQKEGRDKTRWEIAMVATHPDYRRRGLGRKLVTHAMQHAKEHGAEACILYVLAENEPAYKLYLDLGFVHYDSKTEFKLETLPEGMQREPGEAYTLRPMKFDEWEPRFDITLRDTPAEVQTFLPVKQTNFRYSPVMRALTPIMMKLQKMDIHVWAAEYHGDPVAYLILEASRKPNRVHRLKMKVDPAHRAALAEPLLARAIHTLKDYPRENTLFAIRTAHTDLMELLKGYGFTETETQHWLGAKNPVSTVERK